eukprot:Gb_26850 [translate_table: standard]
MAAAVRWRVASRSILCNKKPFHTCNVLHAKAFSAKSDSSNGDRDESEGLASFRELKESLKNTQTDSKTQTNEAEEQSETKSKGSSSPYFQDVKASLRNPNPPQRRPSQSFGRSSEVDGFSGAKPRIASLEEIRKNLSEFRMKSAPPTLPKTQQKPPDDAGKSSSGGFSFQALYESNAGSSSNTTSTSNINADSPDEDKPGKERLSFQAIRESLRQLRSSSPNKFKGGQTGNESLGSFSLKAFGESLRLQPDDNRGRVPSQQISDSLPLSVFGKEMREKASGEPQPAKTEFVKMYSYDELGEKLKKLRPDTDQSVEQITKGFSLTELNERLQKLRELEEKETESKIGGISFKDLRESLVQLRMSSDASNKKSSLQRLALLGQLGGQATPNFMLSPPKDHLVEQYFHPDNMSAAEKLKIELKKVREEFKMSESDCGSSRVQVAQLTTKIKHLSSALHKKDKHSRKGLQGMIQRRKKLLKYLRRTDWDSYCFVLSKLGLRDNPDYKMK